MNDICHPVKDTNLLTFPNYFEEKVYLFETNLFYEEHIPNVGYLLLEGKITLGKKNRALKSIEELSFIGVKNLYQKTPTKFFATIEPNSKVLIIDRSTLFDVINKEIKPFNFLFQ